MFENNFWLTLALRILLGSGAMFAVAYLMRKLAKGVAAERAIWQAALVAISCLAIWEAARFEITFLASFYEGDRPQITVTSAETVSSQTRTGTSNLGVQAEVKTVPEQPKTDLPWAGLLWLGGIAALIGYSLFQSSICFWIKRRSRLVADAALEQMLAELKADSRVTFGVSLHESRFFQTPVAFGLVKKSIGIPLKFKTDFSPEEQKVLLCHELMHLVNRDPLWRLCSDLLCAMSWWNPLAWLARRKFLHACEMTADEGAVLLTGHQTALAETLVAFAQRLKPGMAGNWSGMAGEAGRSTLALRVKRLLNTPMKGTWRKSRWALVKGIVYIPAFLGTSLLLLFLLQTQAPALAVNDGSASAFARIIQVLPQPEVAKTAEVLNANLPLPVASVPAPSNDSVSVPDAAVKSNLAPLRQPVEVAQTQRAIEPDNVSSSASEPSARRQTELSQNSAAAAESVPASAAAPRAALKPQLLFSVKIIEIKGRDLNNVGLAHLFPDFKTGGVNTNISAAANEIKTVRRGVRQTNALPGASLQPMAYKIPAAELKELVKKFETTAGADLLSAPRVTTLPGREATITIGDTLSIVTGFKTNSTPPGAGAKKKGEVEYLVDQMEFGATVRLYATMPTENELDLSVTTRILEFMGYDQPMKPASEAALGKVPLPKFRVREAQAKALVQNGEGLLLTGLITPEEVRTKQKVPGLGDIPLLGRMFRDEQRHTVMKHLLIVIEPTIVNDQGK